MTRTRAKHYSSLLAIPGGAPRPRTVAVRRTPKDSTIRRNPPVSYKTWAALKAIDAEAERTWENPISLQELQDRVEIDSIANGGKLSPLWRKHALNAVMAGNDRKLLDFDVEDEDQYLVLTDKGRRDLQRIKHHPTLTGVRDPKERYFRECDLVPHELDGVNALSAREHREDSRARRQAEVKRNRTAVAQAASLRPVYEEDDDTMMDAEPTSDVDAAADTTLVDASPSLFTSSPARPSCLKKPVAYMPGGGCPRAPNNRLAGTWSVGPGLFTPPTTPPRPIRHDQAPLFIFGRPFGTSASTDGDGGVARPPATHADAGAQAGPSASDAQAEARIQECHAKIKALEGEKAHMAEVSAASVVLRAALQEKDGVIAGLRGTIAWWEQRWAAARTAASQAAAAAVVGVFG